MFQSVSMSSRSARKILVIGGFKNESLDRESAALDKSGAASSAINRAEVTREAGQVAEEFPNGGGRGGYERVLIVGLGERGDVTLDTVRNAAGAVGRRLAALKAKDVDIEIASALSKTGLSAAGAGSAFGEGMGLIAYNRDHFKGSAATLPERTALSMYCSDASFRKGMERGMKLGFSANIARNLSETPPNICTTTAIADYCTKMAKKVGLSCKVLSGSELERERLTGLINVGKASEQPPCMVRLEYKPGGRARRGAKPVVLVGKTMVYDSGGLSIKTGGFMRGMKRDKDGGCAVIGAMHAIATVIKPKVPVVALLAVAENSISDEAYRPDDIITFRNGVTVEVTNTDAEGRLVMADALCWACDSEDPACIVDMATLTGGVVIALGSTYAGMWCDDDNLRGQLESASAVSGERLWRLPHHQEYRDMMKSDVADIINSSPERKAHPIQGAAFLSYFVEPGVAWAHLDIAGVHAVEGDRGPYVKSSCTGFGVRLVAEWLDKM